MEPEREAVLGIPASMGNMDSTDSMGSKDKATISTDSLDMDSMGNMVSKEVSMDKVAKEDNTDSTDNMDRLASRATTSMAFETTSSTASRANTLKEATNRTIIQPASRAREKASQHSLKASMTHTEDTPTLTTKQAMLLRTVDLDLQNLSEDKKTS